MNNKKSAAYLLSEQSDFVERVRESASVSEIAIEYNDYSYETVRRAVKIVLLGYDPVYEKECANVSSTGKDEVFTGNGKIRSINLDSTSISSYDEFVKKHNIDTRIWVSTHFSIRENKWEQGAKDNDGNLIKQPLKSFCIKATFKRNDEAVKTKDAFEDLLEACRSNSPKRRAFTVRETRKSGNMGEFSAPDLHLGKLAWGEEAGEDYDSEIASNRFTEAMETFCDYTRGFELEKILLPLGNDFFNIDGSSMATTAGTPQDNDSRWKKMFRMGRELVINVVDNLSEIAPVEIVIVPGNHDMEASWHMGEALSCWYHNDDNVTVQNDAAWRKYVSWGKCLIGFTHGDKEPIKNLPLIMATEVPGLWAKSTFREFHLGHFHSKRDMMSMPVGEFNGVKVCMLPSLSSNDNWHTSKGYGSQRAAEAFVWNKEKGRIANFSYTP